MDVAQDITHFACPRCSVALDAPADRFADCNHCGWKGQATLFRPMALQADAAEQAMPDDAACAHHPNKRAVTTCEGTGDYICSLCCVEFEGHTLSVQYLETAGKDQARKLFNPHLERPDSTVVLYLLLCFVPYINGLWIIAFPFWIPYGFVKVIQANRLRGRDPLFARLVSKSRLIVLTVLLAIFGLLIVGTTVGLTVWLISEAG